jgi:hypothetical protein
VKDPATRGDLKHPHAYALVPRRCRLPYRRCSPPSVESDHWTAKRTAIAHALTDTHRHMRTLAPQVEVFYALVHRPSDLHGMQEVRGSNPLSSTEFFVHSFDTKVTVK